MQDLKFTSLKRFITYSSSSLYSGSIFIALYKVQVMSLKSHKILSCKIAQQNKWTKIEKDSNSSKYVENS